MLLRIYTIQQNVRSYEPKLGTHQLIYDDNLVSRNNGQCFKASGVASEYPDIRVKTYFSVWPSLFTVRLAFSESLGCHLTMIWLVYLHMNADS